METVFAVAAIFICFFGNAFSWTQSNNGRQSGISQLQQEVIAFRKEMRMLQAQKVQQDKELSELRALVYALSDTVIRQDVEIKTLKKELRGLEHSIFNHDTNSLERKDMTTSDSSVNIEHKEMAATDSTVFDKDLASNRIYKTIKEPKGLVGKDENKRRYLLGQEEIGVAFSTTLTKSQVYHHGKGQTILFDKVISNLGNAYDVNAGIFRAPIKGWYLFSLTMMNVPGDEQQLDVVLNGSTIFHCFANGNEYNTASRSIVVHADVGDDVWVKTANYQHSDTVNGYEHTSFTGFLLYDDNS